MLVESPAPATRLFNRHFVLLWQGQLVSQLGNQLHFIALLFWLKHATDSAGLMGTIVMVSTLPGVLLSPFGGTLADRRSRRAILIACDLMRGAGMLLLAGLLLWIPGRLGVLIPVLFAVSVLHGISGAFFGPALTASIPSLVPPSRLAAANSLQQSSAQISLFAGQVIGGILFRILGAAFLFLVDGISFILSAASLGFIRIPQHTLVRTERTAGRTLRDFWEDTAEGCRYIWARTGMRNFVLGASLLNFLFAPVAVLLPFYIEDHLHARSDWFGFLVAALGAGALGGYALVSTLRLQGRGRAVFLLTSLFLAGICFASLGVTRDRWVALGLAAVLGVISGSIHISMITMLQQNTAEEIRGRVFGLLGSISGGLIPLGMGLAGWAAELANRNIPLLFAVAGALGVLVSIRVAANRETRAFLASAPPAGDQRPPVSLLRGSDARGSDVRRSDAPRSVARGSGEGGSIASSRSDSSGGISV